MMETGVMEVLIMDDSAVVRKRLIAMLSRIVNEEGISYAEDAAEAIDSIRKLNPDALILDIRMPGGNGIDVLLEIKRNNRTLPVIVLTDYPYRQYRGKYVATGADFFFDKSTEFDQMAAVLRRLGENRDADKTTSPRSRDDRIDSRKRRREQMKFLIISRNRYMTPPEVVPSLIDATLEWAHKYEGQIEQIWSFAGQQAGGGIANVESLEELNAILAEFPLSSFSETEIYPLVDLVVSFQQQKETLQSISARV